jgi:hypothetical protein
MVVGNDGKSVFQSDHSQLEAGVFEAAILESILIRHALLDVWRSFQNRYFAGPTILAPGGRRWDRVVGSGGEGVGTGLHGGFLHGGNLGETP